MQKKLQKPEATETENADYRREVYTGKGHLLPILLIFVLICPLALLSSAVLPQQEEDFSLWFGELGDTGIPIGGMIEIDEAWDIEDERAESEGHLVSAMYNGQALLGFEAESNTFYCTLGMENGIDWPELSLTAKGADGLQVAWIDDYSYDWCADAIENGYRYELLAYTDTEFSYIGVVFTGLPIVSLRSDEEIGWDDVYGEVHISGEGYEAIHSMALLHQRGGGYRENVEKRSFHIEFRTRRLTGHEKKDRLSVLGMEADTDWLLIGNDTDFTCIRNEIAWGLWRDWTGEEGITPLDSRLVEVFLNDTYMGIYQLMERIDAQEELARMGGNPATDIVGRKVTEANKGSRPRRVSAENANTYIELRHLPSGMVEDQAFSAMLAYLDLEGVYGTTYDDEALAEAAAERFDLYQMLDYFLFLQAASLGPDNAGNNVYIWALDNGKGGFVYRLSPWDMDTAFEEIPVSINLWLRGVVRSITMDICGSKTLVHEMWKERRETILEENAFYQRFTDIYEFMQRSGAYLREAERWNHDDIETELKEMREYAIEHLGAIDFELGEMWPMEP